MLKPRGFVPWGLPGPTRDAAALAASTRNLNSPDSVREWPGGGLRLGVAGGGRVGVGWGPQITRIPFLCSPPDGLGHRNGPLVSNLIPNILFVYVCHTFLNQLSADTACENGYANNCHLCCNQRGAIRGRCRTPCFATSSVPSLPGSTVSVGILLLPPAGFPICRTDLRGTCNDLSQYRRVRSFAVHEA